MDVIVTVIVAEIVLIGTKISYSRDSIAHFMDILMGFSYNKSELKLSVEKRDFNVR